MDQGDQGSILVCKIFMISAEIADEIFGRNENWILVYFSSKFLAEMILVENFICYFGRNICKVKNIIF
jgi:hypothetical protein